MYQTKTTATMSKRTTFTNITPLPPTVTRQTAIRFLQDHTGMIDLNPLVIDRHRIDPPDYAGSDERQCAWYSITDRIEYLPGAGDWAAGTTSYSTAFHDMPWGLQTHSYAAMGLEIRGKWSVGGSMPGEPHEPQELGLGAPETGLYLREDVDYTCNVLMAGFVKKTMKKAHATLVEALKARAEIMQQQQPNGGGAQADGVSGPAALGIPASQRPPLSQHPVQSSASGRSLQQLQSNGSGQVNGLGASSSNEKQGLPRPPLGQHPAHSSSSGMSLQQQPQHHHQQQPPPYHESRMPAPPQQDTQFLGQQSQLHSQQQHAPRELYDQGQTSSQQNTQQRLLFQQQPQRYQGYQPPQPEVHEAP